MKITICGSMSFAPKMLEAKAILEKAGHVCFLPEQTAGYANGEIKIQGGSEDAKRKMEYDLINKHYQLIKESDAILVLNHDKGGIVNYIGGNSFLEIGFAHVSGKKIFLLNPIPDIALIRQEVEAMRPQVVNGDFDLLN